MCSGRTAVPAPLVTNPVIGINEERLGKCVRQVEHIIGHVFVTVYIGSLVCPLKTLCPTHMMKWLVRQWMTCNIIIMKYDP